MQSCHFFPGSGVTGQRGPPLSSRSSTSAQLASHLASHLLEELRTPTAERPLVTSI